MPLVAVHKARRRAKSSVPTISEGDDYGIAEGYVRRLARSFRDSARNLISDDVLKEIRHYLLDNRVNDAIEAIPWKDEPTLGQIRIFAEVVERSGQDALDRLGWKATFKLGIAKQKVPVVPVNPYSLKWIREHSAELVKEVTESQKAAVRQVMLDGMTRAAHPTAIARRVKSIVGLLSREAAAVERRYQLHLSKGLSKEKAEKLTDKYAAQLLRKRSERIARTELIRAQAKGLHDGWAIAKEAGQIGPSMKRKWIAAPPSGNKDRPCPICLELGTMDPVAIGEPWVSSAGTFSEPPSHPQCRCTVVLVEVPEQPKKDYMRLIQPPEEDGDGKNEATT